MKKLLLISILLGCLFEAHSQFWAPIFTDNDNRNIYSNSTLLVKGRLIIRAYSSGRTGLWVYDSSTNQTTRLLPTNSLPTTSEVVAFKESVYFLMPFSNEPNGAVVGQRLWKINDDFTTVSQVSELVFSNSYFGADVVVQEDALYIRSNEGIVAYDGETFTTYETELNGIQLQDICVFDQQQLIFFNNNSSFGATLIGINQSVVTDYTGLLPALPNIERVVKFNENCYFHYTKSIQNDEPNGFLKVTQTGTTQLYGEDEDGFSYEQIFIHNEEKFAFTNAGRTLSKLASDDTVSVDILTDNNANFTEFKSTESNLFVLLERNNDSKKTIYSIDQNLTPNIIQTGHNLSLPQFAPSLTADIKVERPTHRSQVEEFKINFQEYNGQVTTLLSQGFDYVDTISSATSDDLYFTLRDRATGKRSIYSLTNSPKIGSSLNGIWNDPELENQGLLIKQGTRVNGSNYIFATVYTYRDGDPLWLAGNADYAPSQNSIEIPLFDFRDADFFEPNQIPTQTSFGTVQIELTSCDQLKATVSHNSQTFELILNRIDNTDFNKYCLEQISSE